LTKKLLGGAIALIFVGACTPAAAVVSSPPPSVVAAPTAAVTEPPAGAHKVPWYLKPDAFAPRGDEIVGVRETVRKQTSQ
jgi:hypothetical protein